MNSVYLFHDDYEKIPCIFDLKTKNTSFLRMAGVLKRMGIKNHLFMLALTQPELQGVDPHDPNLDQETILKITAEAKLNPWYFFREVVRIPTQGDNSVMFRLDRANLATIWCFLNNLNVFLTMPRQIGKSVTACAINSYLMYVLGRNITVGMFAKGSGLQAENVSRVKAIRNELPKYLWKSDRKYNSNNQESITYFPHETKYITFVASASKKQARSQGRGETTTVQHWDEFGYYENNDLSYDTATSAADAAIDNSRKAGLPAGIIITTTAGYTNTDFGKYAYNKKESSLRFTERLYDVKDNAELLDIVMKGSNDTRMVYLEFSYKQLGKDEAWFRAKTAGKSREAIATDYLNEWLHGTGDEVIPRHLMDKLLENVMEPISVTIDNGLVCNWWAQQAVLDDLAFKTIPFIIGCDTSDNIGKDFTTLVMTNPRDMSVVMTTRCNQTNIVYIVEVLIALLKRFPRAVFIPERNRAATMIDILIDRMKEERMDPFVRIFNYFVESFGTVSKDRDLSLGSVRRQLGYKTTGAENSRHLLYGKVMTTSIERNYARIFSKVIVDELCGLTIKNGRIDHATTGHDDTLIAYLLTCWFVMYARNIGQYGIKPGEILQTTDEGEFEDSKPIMELKKRIDYLEEQLESGRLSEMVRKAFTYEVKDLKAILELKIGKDDNVKNSITRISVHQDVEKRKGKPASIVNVQSDLSAIFGMH